MRPNVPRQERRSAFVLVRVGVVGLPGLEPGTSSLSEMDGRALCYPAFSLVVLLRKSYKDGVNRCPPPSVRRYVAGSGLGHPPSRLSMAINLPWTRWTEDAIEVKQLEEAGER
jgi:hypothetical protein